jgi:hypothetical protein
MQALLLFRLDGLLWVPLVVFDQCLLRSRVRRHWSGTTSGTLNHVLPQAIGGKVLPTTPKGIIAIAQPARQTLFTLVAASVEIRRA